MSVERATSSVTSEEISQPRLDSQIQDVSTKSSSTTDVNSSSKYVQRLQRTSHENKCSLRYPVSTMEEGKVELFVELSADTPIAVNSVSEQRSNNAVPDSLQRYKSSATEFTSLKRKSHQDLEESRADKRVKVESDAGLSREFLNEDGVKLTTPRRAVEVGLNHGSNLGGEFLKEGARFLVQGNGNSTAALGCCTGSAVEVFRECGEQHEVPTLNGDQYNVDQHMEVATEIHEDGGVDQKTSSSVEVEKVHSDQQLTSVIDAQLRCTNQGTGMEVHEKDSNQSQRVVVDGAKEGDKQVPAFLTGYDLDGVRNCTDLSDLLNDLSADSGDSEDFDEDEFEGGSDLYRETFCDEWMLNVNKNENEVQNIQSCIETKILEGGNSLSNCAPPKTAAVNEEHKVHSSDDVNTLVRPVHTTRIKIVAELLDVSSGQAQRDVDTETNVQGAHDTTGKDKAYPEVVVLDSDSDDDDDLLMIDQPYKTSQWENAVKLEPGGSREPDQLSLLENAVKLELGSVRQVPYCDAGVLTSITASGAFQHPLPQVSHVSDIVRPQESNPSPGPPATGIPSHGNDRTSRFLPSDQSIPPARQPSPNSMQSGSVEILNMAGVVRAGQAGMVLQTKVEDGKLKYYMAPQLPLSNNMSGIISAGNISHPMVAQLNVLPNALSNMVPVPYFKQIPGCSMSSVLMNEHMQPSGMARDSHFQTNQAFPDIPSTSQQSGTSSTTFPQHNHVPSENYPSWQHQAGFPVNPAVLLTGARKAEPGLHDNDNLGPQYCPARNQLAVVKQSYDTTVSTPRVEVARALQNYFNYINQAKLQRARDQLSRRESHPDDSVKEGNSRGLECRPDIVAYNAIKKNREDVNPGVLVGDIPGVEIGDRFTYRHQMAVVGLHRMPNAGIDYGRPDDNIITATAIVLMPKAGYVDDMDNGAAILYTGQGGRQKRNQGAPFVCDQTLAKGNLGLVTNHNRKLPVRVIRGHCNVNTKSATGVLGYTYDGLYMVASYEFTAGINGFKVFKFYMERLEDQPPIPPCITGCTAHRWNDARGALGAQPLQVMEPPMEEVDIKQICAS